MRNVPKVVWVLAAGRVVTSATSFVMLFLTLYLTGERGLSITVAGLVVGFQGAGFLAGNFTGGRWGDRLGHRRVLLVASTLSGAGFLVAPFVPTPALVLLLPVLAYLGATAGTSQGALSALAVPVGERRTSVAIGRAASNAGFVIGPPIGALLVAHSYTALFIVEGTMILVARLVTARLLPVEPPRQSSQPVDAAAPRGLWASVRANRTVLLLLPAIVLVDLVYRQLYTTLPLYLRDQGQPVLLYTVLIALGSGLILLLEIPVALWLRSRPAVSILVLGYALVGVGFALFAFHIAGVVAAAVTGMVVLTAGEILYKTTATAYVLDAAPEHLTGQYQGLYTGAATSGSLLAGPLGGALYSVAPDALWPVCGIICAAAALMVLRFQPRPSRRDAPAAPATASR